MNPYQQMVEEFMIAIGQSPAPWNDEARLLRAKLIAEETAETIAALGFDVDLTIFRARPLWNEEVSDMPNILNIHDDDDFIANFYRDAALNDLEAIDGFCDLIVVTLGGPVAMGIDLDPHMIEVHRANMDKLGGPKREDGKQLKPANWRGPDHLTILQQTA